MTLSSVENEGVLRPIDLNKICNCTCKSSRLYTADRYHGMQINSGTMLLIDPTIKPVDGHLLLAQINGEVRVWRLVTILRQGLESLIDKNEFIEFGDSFSDEDLVIEGVVTHIIYDARNNVFDDMPCI